MSNLTKEILVIGTGGHARFVLATLNAAKLPVKGLITIDDNYNSDEDILTHKIVGILDDLFNFYNMGYKVLVLAIGDNKVRKKIYEKYIKFGFSFPNIIHPFAYVDSSVSIGDANIIGPNVVVGAGVLLGENNIINSSCVIEHETIIGDHCHIAPGAVICGRVIIGDEVMLGANSTIIDKLKIADKTLLGAGSTLIYSVLKDRQKLVGSPAKEI